MRKILLLLVGMMLLTGCMDDGYPTADELSMGTLTITLTNTKKSGFKVQIRNTKTNSTFTATTDDNGEVSFLIPPGIYEANATGSYAHEGVAYGYNGTSGLITVKKNETVSTVISMKEIRTSQVIIKELYNGGCVADDGVTKFQYDKYVILYNNSSQTASLSNLCFGFLSPYNAQATNYNYDAEGKLSYESEGFTPVLDGIWYFPETIVLEPYSQMTVNIHGAIDNAQTISQSVNFANKEYYCMYDPESGYQNTRYYPTPSAEIPTTHYLRAVRWSQSNAWPLSVSSPALILFQIQVGTPVEYATNTQNTWYDGGEVRPTKQCLKIPNEWVVDAIEVFAAGYKDSSRKRLTADVDAGFVWLTNYQGHSLYRNVDKEATEALAENDGKLVYDYSLGVDGSTDSSLIDVEASVGKGAHIIFKDTNNSTNDFHERRICSLRGKE